MNIKSYTKGRTVKTVTIENITTESNDAIRAMAYAHAGETPENCFGSNIARPALENNAIAVVTLYTD